jgi:hypothetical protein
MMAPATRGNGKFIPAAIDINAAPKVPAAPHEVPVLIEMIPHSKNDISSKNLGLMIFDVYKIRYGSSYNPSSNQYSYNKYDENRGQSLCDFIDDFLFYFFISVAEMNSDYACDNRRKQKQNFNF